MTKVRKQFPREYTAIGLAVCLVALAGCAGTSSPAPSATGADSSPCPAVSTEMPKGDALAGMPKDIQEKFQGYQDPVYKSSWADWKPAHADSYKIGIVFGPLSNPAQVEGLKQLEEGAKSVRGVTGVTTLVANEGTVTQQLQQYDQLVREKVDVIVAEPLSPSPFKAKVDQAAQQGIPTLVTFGGVVDTPNAINVDYNLYQSAQKMALDLVSSMGGSGNVLLVRGVQGYTPETITYNAFTSMLEGCKGVKVVGSVVGNYSPSVAKTEVLKFLGTHPGKVDGVAQVGTMGTGVLDAFTQSGRDVPPMTDPVAGAGTLAYWRDNPNYHLAAVGLANYQPIVASTLERMLSGNGPKITTILTPLLKIDKENLSSWVKPDWTNTTQAATVAPQSESPKPESYDAFFSKGSTGRTP